MAKPVIWTVDDDPDVLRAVERDLRRQYGDRYRILAADSGGKALEGVKQLKLRNEPIALFLVDQRMPHMSGVEFLEAALPFFPDAKRVLLTAYADTDAAIKAINDVQISYYLMKPWDPPEERLYPVMDDVLDDWVASYRPEFEGIRVVGNRWSPASYQIKDFLARNQVPYLWLDVEADAEAKRLMESAQGDGVKLPFVVFPDGTRLTEPSINQVASKVGLRTRAEMPFYDLVILGGGPAGLAAAVYGASEGLHTVMIEREAPGGQAGMSSRIENYLGFPSGLSGGDLTRRAVAQARRFGVEMLTPQQAHGIKIKDNYRIITLADGEEISCHALLIATGVSYRTLNVPGIERLTGSGVYYGAANTEALSCKAQDVYIVGGANSAGQGAMYLSRFARKVTMLVRGEGLAQTMSTYLIDQISKTPNIEVQTRSRVVEAHGEKNLEAISIINDKTGETRKVEAAALFIFIGAVPRTECLSNLLEMDEHGFILSGDDLTRNGRRPRGWSLERDPFLLETSVPGIFVAGDVRHGSIKRVASAVGEGSIAIELIHRYLSNVKV
jgi:thioredoxin reductase (NADPH)